MERLYASYNDDIEFLIVYIREAHPNLLKKENYNTGILNRPKNIGERVILATKCVTQFKFTIPMVIDGMDGKVNNDYKAFPVRVTVVDVDGKVVFYAGRGPWDFRLPPVERTLKKLIANNGRMPPRPKPQWGQSVNGMRCGLSIDPENFVLGEPVAAQLRFENTTREPINFYYKAADVLKNIAIDNGNGQTLKLESAGGSRMSRRRRQENPIRKIAPGEKFEMMIEGKIVDTSGQAVFSDGTFQAVYTVEVSDEVLAQIESEPKESIWTGKLASGTYTMRVAAPPPTGCIDCHGESDYHHKDNQSCETCHVGQVDKDDFDAVAELMSAGKALDTFQLKVRGLQTEWRNAFDPDIRSKTQFTTVDTNLDLPEKLLLTMTYGEALAEAEYLGKSVRILIGSTIRRQSHDSLGDSVEERKEEAIKKGEIVPLANSELYEVKTGITFGSPSGAAQFVAGCSVSGPREWQVKGKGESLKQWQSKIS